MRTAAAVLVETGVPLQIFDDVVLSAPMRGQVLIRMAYSGVCRSQVMEVRGGRGRDRFLPHMLGHEGTGVVEAVGTDVTKVAPGDRVVLGWIRGDGLEAGGSIHRQGGRDINAGAVTTFARYAVVSENRCVALPTHVPMDVGALFGCALLTGWGLVTHEADPPPGSHVAIFGLGGLGLSALMACRARGDITVYAVDIELSKLDLAERLGADVVVDAGALDPVEALRRATGGCGVDFAIEAAGRARTIEQAFESIRRGGLTVFASHPPAGETIALDPYEFIAGKRIKGSWGGGARPDRDVPTLAEAYGAGTLPLEHLVARRYPFSAINEAIDDLEAGRAVRPLIELDTTIS